MALSQKPILLIGDNYDITLAQSVNQLISETQNQTLNLPYFVDLFYQLMQSKIDPPLETIWVYSALSFNTIKRANDDVSDHVLIAKELFQLISGCSGPCDSSKSVALLAPVVFHMYKLVKEVLSRDVGDKRVKKEIKKVKSLIGDVLGYICVCCSNSTSKDNDLILSVRFADLVSFWMDGSDDSKAFLPLMSDEICREITVGGPSLSFLAGIVMAEIFLLKMCLDFRVGNRGSELDKELGSWVVGSITGFQSSFFFEILVRMLMEPTLPVTSLLGLEDENILRKVLYDAVILVEYSFLGPERGLDQPASHVRSLAVKRLIVTHEAIELFRRSGDQKRAISYISSFSISRLPSQIIKCVASEIGVEEEARKLRGASPKAFIKWLLKLDGNGITVFDDGISKLHAKSAVEDSNTNSEQLGSQRDAKKPDVDLPFYIDNKGEGEEDNVEEDKETNGSVSAAFVNAAKAMRLVKKGGTKRKEERNSSDKKRIKVLEHGSSGDSDSDGERSSSMSHDDSSSESEVENPSSDEEIE